MKKPTEFVELICEDLSSVGGPMGSEHVTVIFRKAFSSVETAKEYAEKDHKKRDDRAPIVWKRDGNRIHSGDLLSHSYELTKRKIA